MKQWLSLDEYCQAACISRRTFFRRRIPSQALNGATRYSAASLTPGERAKLASTEEEHLNKRPAGTPLSLTPLFAGTSNMPAGAGQLVRVAMTPEQELEAAKKLEVLQPLIDYVSYPTTRDRFAQLRLKDGRNVTTSELMSCYLSETHGIHRATIWRWKQAFDKDGRFGLVRKVREGKGKSSWAAENRELADIAASVYIGTPDSPSQSKTVAWEMACKRAKSLGVPEPSYHTIRRFLDNPQEVSPSMRVMGREGRKRYDAQFAPYIKRGYTEPANHMWISDHAIVDTLVQNDLFGARDLRHMRLRMTTLLDHRARYVVGVAFCEEGSSNSIKRALLRALTRYGIPQGFYCDNGKDYRKIAGGAERHELEALGKLHQASWSDLNSSVMKRLGVPVTFCQPYHPQSKHIERYHRTFHERVDKAFRTYTGGATHLRPDHTTEALARHSKLLQMGQGQYSALPLASEYIHIAETWVEQWYHRQPHGGEGMDGRTPLQCFMDELPAHGSPERRLAPEPEMLTMLLAERTTRKVQNCAITLGGVRLVPNIQDMAAQLQMHELSGREVVVAYDPLEPSFAAVLDRDMHFVCRLEHEQLYRMSPDAQTRGDVATFMQNRNGLAKAVKQSARALRERVSATGANISAEAALRQLAQLPAAVGDSTVHRAPASHSEVAESKNFHSDDIADWYRQTQQGTV